MSVVPFHTGNTQLLNKAIAESMTIGAYLLHLLKSKVFDTYAYLKVVSYSSRILFLVLFTTNIAIRCNDFS